MRRSFVALVLICTFAASRSGVPAARAAAPETLLQSFRTPPAAGDVWVYWWWLNGCVTEDGIVRDLDYMKAKGIDGALVFQAGEGDTPFRIPFLSERWRKLFQFTVAQAERRGITIGLNLCAGWNAGGSWVTADQAVQTLASRTLEVGAGQKDLILPAPPPEKPLDIAAEVRTSTGTLVKVQTADSHGYHRDIAVMAWREAADGSCPLDSWIDLTDRTRGDRIDWVAPEGKWKIVRFGHSVSSRAYTKCTGEDVYFEIDPLRADTIDRHFAETAGVVIKDVKPYVGKSFQFVHIDSGEIGLPDWTPDFRRQFRRLRGYDPFPYLGARAGAIVSSVEVTRRFNEDFERTLADLMVENYYGRLADLAHRNGLGTHTEAAGFQKPCVDGLQALGVNDISMAEFWARRSEPDGQVNQLTVPVVTGGPEALLRNHDGLKTAASAGHIYGRPIVQAEAFTTVRWGMKTYPNWDRGPFALKDLGDRAFAAGTNRYMLHQFVHQPEEAAPGYKWNGVGQEFDRLVTWSAMSEGWYTYLARCQNLLQAGKFAADFCYFQGEWAPSFAPSRWAMNPALPPGFDCDTVNAEILTQHAHARGGQLALDSGMHYRYLVLNQGGRWQYPGHWKFPTTIVATTAGAASSTELAISPETLHVIRQLVEAGVTLIGMPPARAIGLTKYPESDRLVANESVQLWGAQPGGKGMKRVGHGRVIWGKPLAEIVQSDRLTADLRIEEDAAAQALPAATLSGIPNPEGSFSWIHRTIDRTEAYFIANLRNAPVGAEFTFRGAGLQPERWDPMTGEMRPLPEFAATADGGTKLHLDFAPRESCFVVFRTQAAAAKTAGTNTLRLQPQMTLEGSWSVAFDEHWGGPSQVTFDRLVDWSQRSELGIKYYSGKATYRKTFRAAAQLTSGSGPVYLDLGMVREMASVRLNGRDLGVVWAAPWHIRIDPALKAGGNELEITVVNLWPNRLIGDSLLPAAQRLTHTNVTGYSAAMPLMPSGLLGPVTVQR